MSSNIAILRDEIDELIQNLKIEGNDTDPKNLKKINTLKKSIMDGLLESDIPPEINFALDGGDTRNIYCDAFCFTNNDKCKYFVTSHSATCRAKTCQIKVQSSHNH